MIANYDDHDNDPDETEGRKLYRAQADTLARSQIAMAKRRVKKVEDDPGRPVPKHGSGCVRVSRKESVLEHIARDIREGHFPKKSKPR